MTATVIQHPHAVSSAPETAVLNRISHACKQYCMGEVVVDALKDISLEIYAGELVVILGPSGSGKTTLLNLLGGMDIPSSGNIFFKLQDMTCSSEQKRTAYRRYEVGFVFQFFNLIPDLTAAENVALSAELVDNPLNVEDVLEDVGLGHRKNHFPSQLSAGEQQRVAIARAIVKKPSILLCDEPTGALDDVTARVVLSILENVARKRGSTVVIVTHNTAIAPIADRVIRMRSGSLAEIICNPAPVLTENLIWL